MDFVLQEQALSRVLTHAQNGFMILSAFRHENNLSTNLQRHEDLKDALKKWNLGFFELIGYWVEENAPEWDSSQDYEFEESIVLAELRTMDFKINPNQYQKMKKGLDTAKHLHHSSGGNSIPSVEYSIFVPYENSSIKNSYSDFIKIGLFLKDYFDQDAILALDRKVNKIALISGPKNNRVAHPVGEISFKKIGYAYSRLRKRPDKTFMFEGVHVALSVSAEQVGHLRGYNLSENTYFVNLLKTQKLLRGE